MRMLSVRLAMAIVAIAATAALAPAAHAGTIGNPPPDCAVAHPTEYSASLTCTHRPAAQQWRVVAECFPFGRLVFKFGNIVTGNGTSIVNCGTGVPIGDVLLQTL